MAAKELKALADIGTSLGYTGEDLKQWLNDQRMRIDREKEEEKKRAFELEKLKIEAERAKIGQRLKPKRNQKEEDKSLNCGRWKWSMT